MIKLILALTLALSATTARAEDNARTTIPDCSAASVLVFNGPKFDGRLYLHEVDVTVSTRVVRLVHAVAADGRIPAICTTGGIVQVHEHE